MRPSSQSIWYSSTPRSCQRGCTGFLWTCFHSLCRYLVWADCKSIVLVYLWLSWYQLCLVSLTWLAGVLLLVPFLGGFQVLVDSIVQRRARSVCWSPSGLQWEACLACLWIGCLSVCVFQPTQWWFRYIPFMFLSKSNIFFLSWQVVDAGSVVCFYAALHVPEGLVVLSLGLSSLPHGSDFFND